MKTKKIKIIIAAALLMIVLIASTLLTMSFVKVSYIMSINKPDSIIVYFNDETNNKVFTPDNYEYNKIYSLVVSGCKKSVLKALVNNELSNSVKVESVEQSKIKFTNIIINFSYNSPQVVKFKNKNYLSNGQYYWYENLIFTISSNNNFNYNGVAIILPENAINFQGPFNYSLEYKVYSNWHKSYNYINTLF